MRHDSMYFKNQVTTSQLALLLKIVANWLLYQLLARLSQFIKQMADTAAESSLMLYLEIIFEIFDNEASANEKIS